MAEPAARPGRTARGAVALAMVAAVLGAGAPVAMAAYLDGADASATMSTATLLAPSGLSGGVCLLGSVTLTWNATPSTWADGYEIRWSTTNGGPYTTGSTTSLTTTKVVSGLSLLTTYYFVVRAYDGNWRSPSTSQLTVGCV